MRGFTELYRIKEILEFRNRYSNKYPITFIYPFYDNIYKSVCNPLITNKDLDLGRVERSKMYELFSKSELAISIPNSDSSPRSVYEAIFCGCPVIITYNLFYESLPICMKSRIIIVDIKDKSWMNDAIEKSKILNKTPYLPSIQAVEMFDQKESFKRLQKILFE
jgi:hypothetical protein